MRKILFLEGTDPIMNLSHEELLFQNLSPHDQFLVLYRNKPSVIIGTFQNPWLECDVDWIGAQGIPLVRRISGGGTVWHDLGNLNISFMSGRKVFKQKDNLELLCTVLRKLGLSAQQNDRGDILSNGKKISGNAMCFRAEKVLHHATLLIDADLAHLRRALAVNTLEWNVSRSVGVRSKPAQVSRIVDLLPVTSATDFLSEFVAHLETSFETKMEHVAIEAQAIEVTRQKYISWDWNFGRTPEFQLDNKNGTKILVKNGTIVSNSNQVSTPFPGFALLEKYAESIHH